MDGSTSKMVVPFGEVGGRRGNLIRPGHGAEQNQQDKANLHDRAIGGGREEADGVVGSHWQQPK